MTNKFYPYWVVYKNEIESMLKDANVKFPHMGRYKFSEKEIAILNQQQKESNNEI